MFSMKLGELMLKVGERVLKRSQLFALTHIIR